MPLQATSGAASYDAFGGGVPVVPAYIEEVFSTYLYTGNAGTQTVTNGIDLSTKGGMVWTKSRSGAFAHSIMDTVRGFNYSGTQTRRLDPSTTGGEADEAGNATQATPLSDGFSITTSGGGAINFYNASGATYASWTFREQPKFFDIVTWTGDGTAPRTINHNLGSTPGCIIVKRVSGGFGEDWHVFHRSLTAGQNLVLNSTAASASGSIGSPTSTTFTISSAGSGNSSGYPYVAYLFAHNAGGFGLTGTDNVISCGTFDANLGEVINLGYEPQWLLYKASADVDNWRIADNMRGLTNLSGTNAQTIQQLRPNSTGVEGENSGPVLTSTGFTWNQSGGGVKHIYIAIRRGPMKVPNDASKVFAPVNQAGAGTVTTNFPVDLNINTAKSLTIDKYAFSRLTGPANYLNTNLTAAETAGGANFILFDRQNSIKDDFWGSGNSIIYWNFRRAPSFFDEVCYTGTGSSGLVLNHNLTVVPEFIIVKERTNDGVANWSACYNFTSTTYVRDILNRNDSVPGVDTYGSGGNNYAAAPTATTITVGVGITNTNASTYVAYLFATCAGVSKCIAFTGTGTLQTINCGFTSGARFVLIKRTDSTGDWYVWDSSRGLSSSTDPYLLLNSTAAEVTSTNWVDTTSTGFQVTAASGNNVNINGASYIALAIA